MKITDWQLHHLQGGMPLVGAQRSLLTTCCENLFRIIKSQCVKNIYHVIFKSKKPTTNNGRTTGHLWSGKSDEFVSHLRGRTLAVLTSTA